MYKIVILLMIQGFGPQLIVDQQHTYSARTACTVEAARITRETNESMRLHQLVGQAMSICVKLDEGQVI